MAARSDLTIRLVDIFSKLEPGETIEYLKLTKDLKTEINSFIPNVASARRIVERERHVNLAPVRGIGLKRLVDQETVVESVSRIAGIRKAAKKGLRRLEHLDSPGQLDAKALAIAETGAVIYSCILDKTSADSMRHITVAKTDGVSLLESLRRAGV